MLNVGTWLDAVRTRRPLVHNITNLVVTNLSANGLLAVGASPVMAHAHEEVADMASIAQALVLNMGTLDRDVVESMRIAGKAANRAGVPIVFDPVGVGATPYRNRVAADIANELNLAVLRGNAGEMSVFLGLDAEVKGVDSVAANDALPVAMKEYAQRTGTVVVATGPVDYVASGEHVWKLSNGHVLLTTITGSGCLLTALIGAFVGAAGKNSATATYAQACIAAITTYNVAAERAASQSHGPGSFQVQLFDALYHITGEDVERAAVMEQDL
nr:hydroxyethylthiazole kinase [Alicyclobacillus acidiphilus]